MMNWRSCLYNLATYQLCLQKKDKIEAVKIKGKWGCTEYIDMKIVVF